MESTACFLMSLLFVALLNAVPRVDHGHDRRDACQPMGCCGVVESIMLNACKRTAYAKEILQGSLAYFPPLGKSNLSLISVGLQYNCVTL